MAESLALREASASACKRRKKRPRLLRPSKRETKLFETLAKSAKTEERYSFFANSFAIVILPTRHAPSSKAAVPPPAFSLPIAGFFVGFSFEHSKHHRNYENQKNDTILGVSFSKVDVILWVLRFLESAKHQKK